jgi:glycosyltransferase involved in cell wall biosynthesis
LRCLWLTRIDPRPADTGELIYSDRLIEAFARSGAEVTALCLARSPGSPRDGEIVDGVRWTVVDDAQRGSWHSLMSPLPHIASRCAVPAMRRALAAMLARITWDAVILDSLSVGWALPIVQGHRERRACGPRLVYVSHNHEASTRLRVARNLRGGAPRQLAMLADARKAAALEQEIVGAADLVTAISPSDAMLYDAQRAGRPVIELPPGYGGREVEERRITSDMPRRAVIVGSYEWVAKQVNLRDFATVAATALDRAGVDLVVVGKGGAFLDRLRREFPTIRFTGRVDTIYPYLDRARVAVVPERLGGGFKLKALDYIFNRLPIAAIESAIDGVPLTRDDSVLAYPDFPALVGGVLAAIDDLSLLNRIQERAFAACRGRFQWAARGRALLDAVGTL